MGNPKSQYELEIAQAEQYLNDDEPLKAIPHASKAIEIDPSNAQGYLLRSQCYRDSNLILAIVDAETAVDLDPTDGEAYCNRGLLDWDPDRARRDFERGAALGSFTAISALKSLNFKLGKCEPSLADILGTDATGFFNADDADGLWLQARDEKDDAVAVELLTRAIAAGTARRRPYMHCCRAERLEKLGRYDEAIVDYSTAIELDEDWIAPCISRGRAFRAIGKNIEAEQDFDAVLSMDPEGQEEELLERANLQLERENYEEAIEDARRVLWTDSSFVECYLVTGLAFAQMGQLENAAAEYTKAIENSDVPKHPKFLNLRAEVYDQLDRPADAKNDRQIAMSIMNVLI